MDLAGPGRRPCGAVVFLVDGEGTIVERWDNVATETSLRDAVADVLEVRS